MPKNETSANATKYSTGGTQSIKSIFQRISALTGFIMLLFTAGIVESNNATAIVVYMIITASLLYFGKAFRFQTRNNR